MKNNQLTKGKNSRVMYIENKDGDIDGVDTRIGWVKFSKLGCSVCYRGRVLKRIKGRGVPEITLMSKWGKNIGFLVLKSMVLMLIGKNPQVSSLTIMQKKNVKGFQMNKPHDILLF